MSIHWGTDDGEKAAELRSKIDEVVNIGKDRLVTYFALENVIIKVDTKENQLHKVKGFLQDCFENTDANELEDYLTYIEFPVLEIKECCGELKFKMCPITLYEHDKYILQEPEPDKALKNATIVHRGSGGDLHVETKVTFPLGEEGNRVFEIVEKRAKEMEQYLFGLNQEGRFMSEDWELYI